VLEPRFSQKRPKRVAPLASSPPPARPPPPLTSTEHDRLSLADLAAASRAALSCSSVSDATARKSTVPSSSSSGAGVKGSVQPRLRMSSSSSRALSSAAPWGLVVWVQSFGFSHRGVVVWVQSFVDA